MQFQVKIKCPLGGHAILSNKKQIEKSHISQSVKFAFGKNNPVVVKQHGEVTGQGQRVVNKNLNFDSETHLFNRHPNDIIAAKNRET